MLGHLAIVQGMDYDIVVILENQEIQKLESQKLEGIMFNSEKLKDFKPFFVSVDDNFDITHSTLDVKKNQGIYNISLSKNYYNELETRSWVGTRFGELKIDLLEESFAQEHEDFSSYPRTLKTYFENRHRLK